MKIIKIRKIKYNIFNYIMFNLYFLNKNKYIIYIIREFYLIKNFYINILIDVDILFFKYFNFNFFNNIIIIDFLLRIEPSLETYQDTPYI